MSKRYVIKTLKYHFRYHIPQVRGQIIQYETSSNMLLFG